MRALCAILVSSVSLLASAHRLDDILAAEGAYPPVVAATIRASPPKLIEGALRQFNEMDKDGNKKVDMIEFFDYMPSVSFHVLMRAWESANLDGDDVVKFYEWYLTLAGEFMKRDAADHLDGFREAIHAMGTGVQHSLKAATLTPEQFAINAHFFEESLGSNAHKLTKEDFMSFVKSADRNGDNALEAGEISWSWFVLSAWSPFLSPPRFNPLMNDDTKDLLAKKMPKKLSKKAQETLKRSNHMWSDDHGTAPILQTQEFHHYKGLQQSFEWQSKLQEQKKAGTFVDPQEKAEKERKAFDKINPRKIEEDAALRKLKAGTLF